MTTFMDKDFLLSTAIARQLYHDVAADLPIIDYHSHLQQSEIVERKVFRNLTDLWLSGDHYKWRLMRASGVSEDFITGDQDDEAKFRAFCKILPLAIGNPIYQWSHLELRRLFGIELTINAANAGAIWEAANAKLATMDTWSFLEQAGVEIACTTDDPADDLIQHDEIAASPLKCRVLPAYRPDRAMRINRDDFVDYLAHLAQVSGVKINSFASMMEALAVRVAYFHQRGGRISDHAIDTTLPLIAATPAQLEALFAKRLAGDLLTEAEMGQYLRGLLADIGKVYAKFDWAMCLHIGAQRNNNSRMQARLGSDTGYDSISDMTISAGLAGLLDSLDATDELPRTMLFCMNPNMNEVLSSMIGNFQDGTVVGKIQFGPAWWFNDHKEGNLQQMISLANHGVLGTFVGMVTDSRSFASYPRHDYFRRLLCRQLGLWVESGEYPADIDALSQIVRGICYENAKQYFKL
ncbi:glucuronate isomerase [Glaciimonas sp. CA11.2]|uniref:glucuronate isomerase n=1 Tax=unclassified Glaciimonas TaxID=2644401 RepID=UPI002AB4621E|nr:MULTISPECIES: glucuronate isomerase [unclassified Glaciimonas]MDY7545166.1 glucuronate isomerase [Glaciimonas sp. CA11.2]MEB0080986.1 glucuronate isomerase [Glaciimonas sp. Gout2]MEB0162301.1 glucuronate isomerase [Glaciimonas sp. CA11.2]